MALLLLSPSSFLLLEIACKPLDLRGHFVLDVTEIGRAFNVFVDHLSMNPVSSSAA